MRLTSRHVALITLAGWAIIGLGVVLSCLGGCSAPAAAWQTYDRNYQRQLVVGGNSDGKAYAEVRISRGGNNP